MTLRAPEPAPAGATLEELAHEVGGATVQGDPGTRVNDVRHDSRAVEPGDLFVARRGLRSDGRAFLADALARGAAAVACDEALALPVPVLVVKDPEGALGPMSSLVWGHPTWALDVVGITGTNGKTTTAWLVEHCLRATGSRPGLLGTVEHRFEARRWPALHTTPEADDLARRFGCMRDLGATHAVMEVSSHALSMKRVAAVQFTVAALTNVTQDHLDHHGTFEAYADAKRSLFLSYGPGRTVLNVDDAVGAGLARELDGAMTVSARGAPARVRVVAGGPTAHGVDAHVETSAGVLPLRSPLVGAHNVENLLVALGILRALGLPYADALLALRDARGAPGRLEVVGLPGVALPFSVLVDYAHTPDALERVLTTLRATTPGRIVCVFGCGGDRDPSKRAPMGRAVGRAADVAILTTDNPRSEDPGRIAEAAAAGLREAGLRDTPGADDARGWFAVELDRRRAIRRAVELGREGDLVLIAGKGHETWQEVRGVRTPFDDREEARGALRQRFPGA
ncbi:MAG: UDP-N-acetylmuramoyl-L-alanyl-D-glutamate--2,6-diaminopimelate ligase [Deltaproteobacteria bacterium]|nr:UDP-N-acetylmuramoyl-L-alanyl-D-glutamate--2,6-diaminopimelate ligase [Deltaproteobacteria bacterium]